MTLQKVNFYYANIKKIASKLYINCLIRGGKRIMARETLLQMNCSRFSEKIIDIIDLLFKIGWKYFSNDGMVEYLPIGDIDDYNWEKYKDDGYGNTFVKEVKNPVKQVKRQIYILAKYLEGYNVWVEGYVILIRSNSPVQSTYILQSVEDIDRAIHTFKRNHLSRDTVESIKKMLV